MINGVAMSGSTQASMTYITVADGDNSRDFSRESFVDVVNTQFQGQLSAAKVLKKKANMTVTTLSQWSLPSRILPTSPS